MLHVGAIGIEMDANVGLPLVVGLHVDAANAWLFQQSSRVLPLDLFGFFESCQRRRPLLIEAALRKTLRLGSEKRRISLIVGAVGRGIMQA